MLIKEGGQYLVTGASSGIGLALTAELLQKFNPSQIFATHRSTSSMDGLNQLQKTFTDRLQLVCLDAQKEADYLHLAELIQSTHQPLDAIINCIGVLNENKDPRLPERKVEDFDHQTHLEIYQTNTLPTLFLAKHLKKNLMKSERPLFMSLSAKVGSIGDNQLGGWYSYRISKAALNMAVKTLAVEFKRLNKNSTLFVLHPGTTDTKMTQDFLPSAQKKYTIHSPLQTAENIVSLFKNLESEQAHDRFLSYDGSPIPW